MITRLIFVTLFCCQLPFSQAFAGEWVERNGGNPHVIEAKKIQEEIRTDLLHVTAAKLISKEFYLRYNFGLYKHLGIVQFTTTPLFIGKTQYSAVNELDENIKTKKNIIIYTPTWEKMTYELKKKLLFHELLPVAGFMDKDYRVSGVLSLLAECYHAAQNSQTITCESLDWKIFPVYTDYNHEEITRAIQQPQQR